MVELSGFTTSFKVDTYEQVLSGMEDIKKMYPNMVISSWNAYFGEDYDTKTKKHTLDCVYSVSVSLRLPKTNVDDMNKVAMGDI